jgi:predicted phage baseplate assembly protein
VIVSGESATTLGLRGSEATVLTAVSHQLARDGRTVVTLADHLVDSYLRRSVSVNANVVLATHGESREEILGSGDGSQAFQRFELRQAPLTYLSTGNVSGAETTLQVFVNDLRWQEVPSLFGRGLDERVYISRLHDDGTTTVQFGDGRTGARLPTGVENVRATYRVGAGLAGRVKAGQLSMLVVKPPGVAAVTNPRPATGGSDRETLADAATNAPLTVLTLDRIVSLLDYESFARAFAGVSKALATWTRTGDESGVLLTVAGPNGAAIDEKNVVHTSLLAAIQRVGDPFVPVRVVSYLPRFFRVAANLKLDPAYQARLVEPAVERALRAAFGFESRSFGQPVVLSEVIAVLHSVDGVLAVEVVALHYADADSEVRPVLEAISPRPGADSDAEPAQLLLLDPGPLQLGNLP